MFAKMRQRFNVTCCFSILTIIFVSGNVASVAAEISFENVSRGAGMLPYKKKDRFGVSWVDYNS